jgi:hypothetical protein
MFELWELKRERDRIEKSYQKHLAELKKKKASPDEFEQLRWQESNDVGDAYQQIHIFMSQQLLQEGYKYDARIPATNDTEFWVVNDGTHVGYLTPAGRNHVRRLIDEEKTRRFEVKTLWVTRIILPLTGVLVGLIGAATGFIAVWRHGK